MVLRFAHLQKRHQIDTRSTLVSVLVLEDIGETSPAVLCDNLKLFHLPD